MLAALFQFLLCAGVISIAGSFLVHYADEIAEITGLGRMLVGSVLLAGATSLPELTVDISAVRLGESDLAVGDLLGSSMMNLLILAALDLSHRSRGKMLSRISAAHALSGTMSVAMTALVGLGILASPKLFPEWSFLNVGIVGYAILLAYTLGVRMVFLDQRIAARAHTQVEEQTLGESGTASEKQPRLWQVAVRFGVAALFILVAGPYLAQAAGEIAERSGLASSFVGTTFVAISTSLPELVASFIALRIGAFDLAVGNVYGSNAFNMVLLVVLDALEPGSIFTEVSPSHVFSCLAVIMSSCVAVMGQLYQVERRWRFIEPDAVLVIAMILCSLALIYRLG